MRRLLMPLALAGVLLALVPAAATAQSAATVARVNVEGFATANFGDCPVSEPWPLGTACRDSIVSLFREVVAFDGGSVALGNQPWIVTLDQLTATQTAGGIVESDFASGVVENPTSVAFDTQHLSFASVRAQIPMSDGSNADIDLSWEPTSARVVFGNDGHVNADFGIPRHDVGPCFTFNSNAHEKIRVAEMTGTLNGAKVQSYPLTDPDDPPAFIEGPNRFSLIDVTKARCS
jgi:hypothetical protein